MFLLLLLEITGNMCIVNVCYPVCGVINFEIYLGFLIKTLSYKTKIQIKYCQKLSETLECSVKVVNFGFFYILFFLSCLLFLERVTRRFHALTYALPHVLPYFYRNVSTIFNALPFKLLPDVQLYAIRYIFSEIRTY